MNPIAEQELSPASDLAARATRRNPDRTLRNDLRAILGEGAASSIMVGVGESYLPAFALAMGMGQVAAGLITTIPLLVGALLQLISPVAVRYLGSHRRWVVACALLQAASFVPLCIAALVGSMPTLAIFVVAALYWGSGMGTSPAWSTWVDTLVPRRLRVHYFSRRTRICQIATLLGFVVGGVGLQVGAWADRRLTAFALLFLLASICRAISAAFLASQSEPRPLANGHRQVAMREFFARFRRAGDGRLLFYFLSVQTAAQIAGPYFTPYMLGTLRMSYATYVILIAISFAAKAFSLPAFGRFAHRFGTRRLLWLGGWGIVPISGLWVISNSFPFLVLVQILAGVTWAAYELAMLLLFFETIRPEERTSILTTFNFANSLATAAGSLLGGGLLAFFGQNQQAYLLLFALSSAARALALLALARAPRPWPAPTRASTQDVAENPTANVERATLPGIGSSPWLATAHPQTVGHDTLRKRVA